MQVGFIGLGKMGKNMVLRLLERGIEVVVWNRSPQPLHEAAEFGAIKAESVDDLISKLKTPRIIWLMLTAGVAVDEFISQLAAKLTAGDLVIDGGNSFYKDTIKRSEVLSKEGIHFVDIGISGGPNGARNGACLMVGGSLEDFERIKDLVIALSSKDAYGHFGPVGSGHFTKMVHNGIEYGMMEAIAEGASILKNAPFGLDLPEVFRVYNNGSVIQSRLVGWSKEALTEDPDLAEVSSVINSTGEGEWTIQTAQELGVKAPVISASFEVRQSSQKDPEYSPQGYRNKLVSAMRGKFGQHQVKKS